MVVLTPCPPGPPLAAMLISRSFSSTCTSTSSASGSTATVAVDVWMRPCVSVAGTRCTRCTPPSKRSCEYTSLPVTSAMHSLMPPVALSLCVQDLDLPALASRRTASTCGRDRPRTAPPPRRPRRCESRGSCSSCRSGRAASRSSWMDCSSLAARLELGQLGLRQLAQLGIGEGLFVVVDLLLDLAVAREAATSGSRSLRSLFSLLAGAVGRARRAGRAARRARRSGARAARASRSETWRQHTGVRRDAWRKRSGAAASAA